MGTDGNLVLDIAAHSFKKLENPIKFIMKENGYKGDAVGDSQDPLRSTQILGNNLLP